MFVTTNNAELFVMPSRLKSNIMLVLDRLQYVARVNCLVGITESWENNDITNAELGLEGYLMFRKYRMGRRGGVVLLYIKETIPAYEVQLQEEADCKEALWCNLVTGRTTVTIGVVYRCPNITLQNHEKIHEVSKGDCIIMGDINHGNIKWDSQQSTGVEDQQFVCLVQDNFLTQHVLEPTRASIVLDIVLSSQTEFVDNVVIQEPLGSSDDNLLYEVSKMFEIR